MQTRILTFSLLFARSFALFEQCYSCSNSGTGLKGVLSNDDEACWFDLKTSDLTDCSIGQCYVRVDSDDGYPMKITRGCLTDGSTDATIGGLVGLRDGLIVDQDSGDQYGCDTDITTSADPKFSHTCAKSCVPVAGTDSTTKGAGCNTAAFMTIESLVPCSKACGTAGSCNFFTGECAWNCLATQRPILNSATDGVYECKNYVCTTPSCGSGAQCTGSGTDTTNEADTTGSCACITSTDIIDTTTSSTTTTCAADTTVVTVNPIKCIQCTSDTSSDSSCASGTTTATDCPNASLNVQVRCAATSTIWVSVDGESQREVVERGCTDDSTLADVCTFGAVSDASLLSQVSSRLDASIDWSKSTEIACRYVCATDGCNNETPDGWYEDNSNPIVTCPTATVCNSMSTCSAISGTDIDSLATSACAGKCMSEMKYYWKLMPSGSYERVLYSLEYGCKVATTTVDAIENVWTCSDETLSTAYASDNNSKQVSSALSTLRGLVHQVTCTTVCDDDYCTAGFWPGRPRCNTCSNTASTDDCYLDISGSSPSRCSSMWDDTCYIKQTGLHLGSNWAQKSYSDVVAKMVLGSPRSISRGCYTDKATGWYNEDPIATRDEDQSQYFYMDREYVCDSDMCNFGPALKTPDN